MLPFLISLVAGAAYIFVRTAVIETGLALVGIPVNDGLDAAAAKAAETLFDATDEALKPCRWSRINCWPKNPNLQVFVRHA